MNFLDRAVAYVAPRAGLRRALARDAFDTIARSYDGAARGRRTANWTSTNASANALTKASLTTLRARSRDLVRNTWWGNRISRVFAAHTVGTGILPRSNDSSAIEAWNEWGATCDAEGQLDINGLIALAVTCIIESGEVLIRFVPRPPQPGKVPLEVQLLEPDHLDASRDRIGGTDETSRGQGIVVDQGIAYGADGKRVGYWLLPEHPGQRGLIGRQPSVFVPAHQVAHAYRKDRIGQGRGVPWLAPVILKGRDLSDLEEAVVVKARVEACLAAFVKTNEAGRTLAAAAGGKSSDGSSRRIETLSPGMVSYLEMGEELQTVNPSASINFESVLVSTWMTLAAGAGITYDQMTGDLRQANYSSLRAGKIEFRRLCEQFQWLTIVPMILQPIWNAFAAAAQDNGVIRSRIAGYPVRKWIMPAVEPIDPLKDLQADILAVRSGRMTWDDFVASWGLDPDAQLDEIAEWLAKLDAKKVALDTDPRQPAAKVAATGITGDNPPDVARPDAQQTKDGSNA